MGWVEERGRVKGMEKSQERGRGMVSGQRRRRDMENCTGGVVRGRKGIGAGIWRE